MSDDGGPRLDMMFGLSRKDWPFLVMARTALFDSVTTERAVLGNCLTEQTVIFKTVLRWVVSKMHDHQCLALSHFQSSDWEVGQVVNNTQLVL